MCCHPITPSRPLPKPLESEELLGKCPWDSGVPTLSLPRCFSSIEHI